MVTVHAHVPPSGKISLVTLQVVDRHQIFPVTGISLIFILS